jgi:hypothetical protein
MRGVEGGARDPSRDLDGISRPDGGKKREKEKEDGGA